MKTSHQVANAVWSGAVAGLGSLSTALVGNESLGQVSAGQWVTVALAALLAAGGVAGFNRYTSSSSTSSST